MASHSMNGTRKMSEDSTIAGVANCFAIPNVRLSKMRGCTQKSELIVVNIQSYFSPGHISGLERSFRAKITLPNTM